MASGYFAQGHQSHVALPARGLHGRRPHRALVNDALAEGAPGTLVKALDIEFLVGFLAELREQDSVLMVDGGPQFR
ncbi:MAG: hypothetical protein WBB22_15690 [Anaerolineae bacterium]